MKGLSLFLRIFQRHGIRGDAPIDKMDTQPHKIVSDLAAASLYSRASTARLLHCINSVRFGKVPPSDSIGATPPKGAIRLLCRCVYKSAGKQINSVNDQ